jgi:predicted O-methyltransferase YrrM
MAHRSDEILKRLPPGKVIGAEIGVFGGATSARLLRRDELTLFMVDPWTAFVADGAVIATDEDQENNLKAALAATEFAENRRHVIRESSCNAAEKIEDGALDFVFIDGDHSYNAVDHDIQSWLPKIKVGGLLCGHDYANPDYLFGDEVRRAVDNAAKQRGWHVDLGGDLTWFVRV